MTESWRPGGGSFTKDDRFGIGGPPGLSSFANGASHVIQFEYVNPGGSGKSNFVVDDLTIDCSASGT